MAESIRRNPTAYQCELSTELGVEDEKSFDAIVNAIGKSAKPIGSAMSKTQITPWYEESNETLEPLITARKTAWIMYLRNQKELWQQYKEANRKARYQLWGPKSRRFASLLPDHEKMPRLDSNLTLQNVFAWHSSSIPSSGSMSSMKIEF